MRNFINLLRSLIGCTLILYLVIGLTSHATSYAQDNLLPTCSGTATEAHWGELMRFGHGQPYDMAVSPDGRTIAVATSLGVWLYDGETLTTLQLLEKTPNEQAFSVTWSPDGLRIAVGYVSDEIHIWDVEKTQVLSTVEGYSSLLQQISWSPDGRFIAALTADGVVRVWDIQNSEFLDNLESENSVTSMAWSPDGSRLALSSYTAGDIGLVHIWNIGEGLEPTVIEREETAISSLAWSPDGTKIAFANEIASPFLEIWDVRTQEVVNTLEHIIWNIRSLAWSPDGAYLAVGGTGSEGNTLLLWGQNGENDTRTVQGNMARVAEIGWASDGLSLISMEEDSTLRAWDLSENRELAVTQNYWGAVQHVAWSPDGKQLAASYLANEADGVVKVWDIANGEVIEELEQPFGVFRMAWSPSDMILAVLTWEGNLRAWNTNNITSPLLDTTVSELGDIVWSPDGRQLAIVGEQINILDATTGEEIATLETHSQEAGPTSSWSRDGFRWATADGDGTVKVWQADHSEPLLTLNSGSAELLSLSPSGEVLAVFKETIEFWRIADERILARLPDTGGRIAWSREETCIASADIGFLPGYSETTIKIWDIPQQEQLATLEGHTTEVNSLAWSPTELRLASAGDDGTIRIWGVQSSP